MIFSKYLSYCKNISIYLAGSLITMGISLITSPVFSLNLDPYDFAVIGFYSSFNALLLPFVGFYLTNFYTRKYYVVSVEERKKIKASIMKFLIFISPLLTLFSLLVVFIYLRFSNTGTDFPFFPYAWLSFFTVSLNSIYMMQLVEYKIQGNSKDFFWLSVVFGVLSTLFSLLLVVVFRYAATGKLLGPFIANLILYVWCIYKNRDCLQYKIDRGLVKEMLLFCYPLVIAAMLNFFTNGVDRVFLEQLNDVHTLGIYVVGVQIASYISVFGTSINNTFQPDLFKSIAERNMKKCFKVVGLQLLVVGVIVTGFLLFAPYAISLLTAGRYVDATPYARIIALSSVTSVLYFAVSNITVALGQSQITLMNKIAGSILSVLLYIVLIRHFTFVGAAWGLVFSYLIFLFGNLGFLVIYRKKISFK